MSILNDLLNGANAVKTPASQIITGNGALNGGTANGGYQTGIQQSGALDPQNLIYNAAFVLLWALGIAAVLTFIYAGFKYVTAGGDAEKAESAKKIIIGSVIGLLLVIGSYLIFNTAVTTLSSPANTPADQILNKTYP